MVGVTTDNKRRLLKMARYLRIANSAFFGVVALMMIAWWVRSFWWQDGGFLKVSSSRHIQFDAGDGRMCIWFENTPIQKGYFWSRPITVHTAPDDTNRIPLFDVGFWPTFIRVYAAHWFLMVVALSLAAIPWCPRKFSLRALLICVTVVALALGTIVWVDNNY
jgi:hypothetical protein